METRTSSQPEKQTFQGTPEVRAVIDSFNEKRQHFTKLPSGERVNNFEIHDRSRRVTDIVRDFSLGRVHDALFDITSVYGIIEQLNDDITRKTALAALRHYNNQDLYSDTDETRRVYFSGIVEDFELIDRFIAEQHTQNRETSGHEPYADELAESGDSFPIIEPEKLARFISEDEEQYPGCEGINIEAILVKASVLFDSLRREVESKNPDLSKLTDYIYAAESFYAPVCELIGYDALSMALRDYALRVRIAREPGGVERINTAKAMIESLGTEEDIQGYVEDILNDFLGENIAFTVVDNNSKHNLVFGIGAIEFTPPEETGDAPFYVKVRYRLKTVGSLAKKLKKYPNPSDILGITLITGQNPRHFHEASHDNVEAEAAQQVGDVYNAAVNVAANNQGFIEPVIVPGKESPYCVEGDTSYVQSILEAVPEQDLDIKRRDNGFQVAKLTCTYHSLKSDGQSQATVPSEIQVQTRRGRQVARIGQASHIIYKVSGREGAATESMITHLEELHERRATANAMELTPQSEERAVNQLIRLDTLPLPAYVGQRAVEKSVYLKKST